MGAVNWMGVIVAALAASAVWLGLNRGESRARWLAIALLMLLSAAMLGHNFARIGAETLAAKPKLYFMQAGGLAVAFVIPGLLIAQGGHGMALRQTLRDSVVVLAAYLVMGAVFLALA